MKQFSKIDACLKIEKDFENMHYQKMIKTKSKKKRERSRKQTEFHLNVEYKFALNDDLEENTDQTI